MSEDDSFHQDVEEALEELERRRERARDMGDEEKIEQRREQGTLNARERIEALLDGGEFFEVGQLAHSDVEEHEEKTPADGKICGFGTIEDRPVAVEADDATVLAGSGGRVGSGKELRLFETAVDRGMPFVKLGEAGGARIPDIMGSDGLSSMTMGSTRANRNRRIPMVATIMGNCFGAPSWAAGLADFVVQVKGSCMAVSGPRVLEMATGEQTDPEELGGWELQARVTGQADRVAEDEEECFQIVRDFLSFLPSHAGETPPERAFRDDEAADRQERLKEILPDSARKAYDMKELLGILVDDETLFPVKPLYDPSVITCLARLDGHPVGIIANQPKHAAGAMGPDGCDKCCQFIALCDSFHIPLLFVHDTPGFRVGKDAERKKMPGKIINFIEAVAMATVPKISLVVRKSYGMAYSNMCGGRNMNADFEFAWPTADISFMDPAVAANVVYGRRIEEADDPEAMREEAVAEMRRASAPWRAAGLDYLDDVIAPAETRATLIRAFEIARRPDGGKSERRLSRWPTTF